MSTEKLENNAIKAAESNLKSVEKKISRNQKDLKATKAKLEELQAEALELNKDLGVARLILEHMQKIKDIN